MPGKRVPIMGNAATTATNPSTETPNAEKDRQPVPMDQRNKTTSGLMLDIVALSSAMATAGIVAESVTIEDLEVLTDGEIDSRYAGLVKDWLKYFGGSATSKPSELGIPQRIGFKGYDDLLKDYSKDQAKASKGSGYALIFGASVSGIAKSIDDHADAIVAHIKATAIGAAIAAKSKGIAYNVGTSNDPVTMSPASLLRLGLSSGSGSATERKADLAKHLRAIK